MGDLALLFLVGPSGVSILAWSLLGQSRALEKTSVICLDVCTCVCTCVHTSVSDQKQATGGLPWWLSGKESVCQCRRRGFDPWYGEISHALEQLSLSVTATESVL